MVSRSGRQGVIDRINRLVVPAKYQDIRELGAIDGIPLFSVADPDNWANENRHGVVDGYGRLVIPMRYSSTSLRSIGDFCGFEATETAYNRTPQGVQQTYTTRWLEYPSGREKNKPIRPDPPRLNEKLVLPLRTVGKYFIMGPGWPAGLMSRKGKVLIPCCKVTGISGDTLFVRSKERQVAKDSLLVVYTPLRMSNLKPYGPPVKRYIYYIPPSGYPSDPMCGSGLQAAQERARYERRRPELELEGKIVSAIYKDSMFWSLQHYAVPSSFQKLYTAIGRPRTREYPPEYATILDSNLNYIIPLLQDVYVVSFNPEDSLAVIHYHGERSPLRGQSLVSLKGEPLIPRQPRVLTGGFRWHGKVYGLASEEGFISAEKLRSWYPDGRYLKTQAYQRDPNGYYREQLRLTDSTGALVATLSQYTVIIDRHAEAGFQEPVDAEKLLWVRDTADKIGIFTPDGRPVYPKLNFRFRSLTRAGKHLFVGRNEAPPYGQWLLDSTGTDLLPGFRLQLIRPARVRADRWAIPKSDADP